MPKQNSVSALSTTTAITTVINWGINSGTVNNASYYVTDSDYNVLSGCTVSVDGSDLRRMILQPPAGGFDPNEFYTVWIGFNHIRN